MGAALTDPAHFEADLARVRFVSAAQGAPRPARRHALRRRAADAGDRALMSRPRLLLDEPSLGLAPSIARQIFARSGVNSEEKLTVFLVEQNAFHALKSRTAAMSWSTG